MGSVTLDTGQQNGGKIFCAYIRMGSIDVYLKLFIQKLMKLLGNEPQKKKKKKERRTLTSVPEGYSLVLQGTDVCEGTPFKSGTLDVEPVTAWGGDLNSVAILEKAKDFCDANKKCNFISVWKEGQFSMYDQSNLSLIHI